MTEEDRRGEDHHHTILSKKFTSINLFLFHLKSRLIRQTNRMKHVDELIRDKVYNTLFDVN